MTTDRPEDARLVAAREGVVAELDALVRDHHWDLYDAKEIVKQLERAAAEAAVSALPCLQSGVWTARFTDGGDSKQVDCGKCPTCTARRAREMP